MVLLSVRIDGIGVDAQSGTFLYIVISGAAA